MANILGSFGVRATLHIKQGSVFGPMLMRFTNPPDDTHDERWPVDLTGSSFSGRIRREMVCATDTDPIAEFTFNITDAENGEVEFELPADAFDEVELGATKDDPESQFVFDIDWIDAFNRPRSALFGNVVVMPNV